MTLNVAGPLIVSAIDSRAIGGEEFRMGPYLTFSMTDGLYVDQRVFGLWDSRYTDWYLKDASLHCKHFHVRFDATD